MNDAEDDLADSDSRAVESAPADVPGSEFWTAVDDSVINRLVPRGGD